MKKIITYSLVVFVVFITTSCKQSQHEAGKDTANSQKKNTIPAEQTRRPLVIKKFLRFFQQQP